MICGAEQVTPRDRADLEAAFGPVFDVYGCREVMMIGARVRSARRPPRLDGEPRRRDRRHRGRRERPAREGETGEVVFTDLHNFAMPFIRYANGDVATAGPTSAARVVARCLGSRRCRAGCPRRCATATAPRSAASRSAICFPSLEERFASSRRSSTRITRSRSTWCSPRRCPGGGSSSSSATPRNSCKECRCASTWCRSSEKRRRQASARRRRTLT